MPVLIEAISVIVRRDSIENRVAGGWNRFVETLPNQTLCADDDLARVGFMTPRDMFAFVRNLEALGLRFLDGRMHMDVAVVDQEKGLNPEWECDWLEIMRVEQFTSGISVVAGRLRGNASFQVALPASWKYEGSMSQKGGRMSVSEAQDRLRFLRHENDFDVYLDRVTGRETYQGRSKKESQPGEE